MNTSEQLLHESLTAERTAPIIIMLGLSVLVGIFSGFGAIIFRAMIGFITNLAFYGHISFHFDANEHLLPSRWGMGVIFVPVVGAVLVTWLTERFAREARGHGVPEVMYAIYYREGKIRPIVALIKSIASSISLGTGGSVGREGPIIQIGAAFGSMLGQFTHIIARQRIVLIAAGAAAAISATFNTPVGGLAFAVELMLVTISAANVAIVITATVTATMVNNLFIGVAPTFNVPQLLDPLVHALNPFVLFSFLPFAIIMGVISAIFIHSIYWFEDRSALLVKNPYYRHMLGMLLLGIIIYILLKMAGQYYVAGVGYGTILDILKGILSNPWLLLALCALKILSTGLTLGTGASGGVFSPSLFIGATMGAAYGGLLNLFFPMVHIPVVLYTITGMAAMIGGSTGAVLTAITMTFEQTHDYSDILPIMLTVAITYIVRVKLTSESIYTLKLYRRGLSLPQGLQAAISVAKKATELMEKNFAKIDLSHVSDWVQQQSGEVAPKCALVIQDGAVYGVIRRELNYLISGIDMSQLIERKFITVFEKTTWPTILRRMNDNNVNVILVLKHKHVLHPDNVIGIITRHEILKSSQSLANLLD